MKEKKTSWKEFNLLLETVDLEDKIGDLFFVDIEFYFKDAFPKQICIMKYIHQLLKKKIGASEKSVFQLTEQYSKTDK